MRWLTQKQIIAASKKSDLAALECSRKHWEQLRDASFEEIREADEAGSSKANEDHCACCKRYDPYDCGDCPLLVDSECCDHIHCKAYHLHMDITLDTVPKHEWVKACQNLIDFIDSKIEEAK